MPKNLSSEDVAWILRQIGITLRRRGKEDVYSGQAGGQNRVEFFVGINEVFLLEHRVQFGGKQE